MSATIQYKGETLRAWVSHYNSNGAMAVILDCDEGSYGVLSVNVQEASLEDDEFVLNHDFNHSPDLVDAMVAKGLIEKTDKTVSYGWVQDQPVYRVTPALLGE